MSKRKPIPKMTPPTAIDDLLDPRPAPPKSPITAKAERQTSRKPERQIARKTEKQRVAKTEIETAEPIQISKSKCTYYIPTDLAERIDVAHAQSRIYTRSSHYKASKSEFIEAAVIYALNEFDKSGKQSEIVSMLAELLAKRAA